jgi:hypothetical protein
MKSIYISLLSLFLPLFTQPQSYSIKNTPTLSYLFKTKSEIGKISNTEKLELFKPNLKNWKTKFSLIKDKNGLFALLDGTGQVFKATNLDKENITFTRIDSTQFYGNNFAAINFSYKGTIYSFGGYGFWNLNGQLRHFTPGAEWVIDKVNKTYGTVNSFYNYQRKTSKIYYVEFKWLAESTYSNIIDNTIIEFDLNNKENKIIGKLNPQIDLAFQYFSIDIPSLSGTLGFNKGEIFLYNFSANKVYKLINKNIKDELISKANFEIQTTFEENGKLFYSFNNDTALRSLPISMSDFKEEPYPFYISTYNENDICLLILILFLTISATLIFVYTKRNKRKNASATIHMEETYSMDLNSNEFNSIEIALIDKLIQKSNKDAHLTVDELNTILGIKKKTIEIQKRVRTEAINRINHKFNINFNQASTFIERTRSKDDRRYFNYIINEENSKIYLTNTFRKKVD